jgi:hypothetical protein
VVDESLSEFFAQRLKQPLGLAVLVEELLEELTGAAAGVLGVLPLPLDGLQFRGQRLHQVVGDVTDR